MRAACCAPKARSGRIGDEARTVGIVELEEFAVAECGQDERGIASFFAGGKTMQNGGRESEGVLDPAGLAQKLDMHVGAGRGVGKFGQSRNGRVGREIQAVNSVTKCHRASVSTKPRGSGRVGSVRQSSSS